MTVAPEEEATRSGATFAPVVGTISRNNQNKRKRKEKQHSNNTRREGLGTSNRGGAGPEWPTGGVNVQRGGGATTGQPEETEVIRMLP